MDIVKQTISDMRSSNHKSSAANSWVWLVVLQNRWNWQRGRSSRTL